jgi:hypothetical protein
MQQSEAKQGKELAKRMKKGHQKQGQGRRYLYIAVFFLFQFCGFQSLVISS